MFIGVLRTAVLVASSAASSRGAPWVEWQAATDRVVSHTDDAAGYPRAIRLKDGTILLAYHHGEGHGAWGKFVTLRHSRDGGKTWDWTAQVEGPEAGFHGFSNPDIRELIDGRLLLLTAARGMAPADAKPGLAVFTAEAKCSGLRLRWSADKGKTWSAPMMAAAGEGRPWEPVSIEHPDGTLEICFAHERRDLARQSPEREEDVWMHQSIDLIRSRDGGRTWSAPSRACHWKGMRNGMPSAVRLNDGRVAIAQEMVLDPEGRSPVISFTRDGRHEGKDLVSQRALGFGAAPFLLKLPDGSIACSFHSGSGKEPPVSGAEPFGWMWSRIWVMRGNAAAAEFTPATAPWLDVPRCTGMFFGSLMLKDEKTLVALASVRRKAEPGPDKVEIRWVEGRLNFDR